MAKKEKDAAEAVEKVLSQKELEAKFSGENEPTEKEVIKIKIKTKSNFSLSDYKKDKQGNSVNFKPQTWINMSPAFRTVTALPGIPCNSITVCHGRSNSGKSTMALELAKYAQEQDIIPVFIS